MPQGRRNTPLVPCWIKHLSIRLQHSLGFIFFCTLNQAPSPPTQIKMLIAMFHRQWVAVRSPSPVAIPNLLWWSWTWHRAPWCWSRCSLVKLVKSFLTKVRLNTPNEPGTSLNTASTGTSSRHLLSRYRNSWGQAHHTAGAVPGTSADWLRHFSAT